MEPALELSLTDPSPRPKTLPRRLVAITPSLLVPEGAVPPPVAVLPIRPEPASARPPAEARQNAEPVALPSAAVELPVDEAPNKPTSVAREATSEAQRTLDPSDQLVGALVGAAQALGATRAAAAVPALIQARRVEGLPEEILVVLKERGFVTPEGTALSPAASAALEAWLHVVRGETGDLEACGSSTLDSWAADLLCALAGAPRSRSADFRRELRRRGVAAFGLITV